MQNNQGYTHPDYVRAEKFIKRIAYGMVAFIAVTAITFWSCVFYFGWIH
jgi:hypothetical protein